MRRTFLILCIIALVVACNNLMAQDDNTSYDRNSRISDQLKNGTAPGLRFGPASKKTVPLSKPTAAEKSTSISKQLKSNAAPGVNYAQGGGAAAPRRMALDSKSRTAKSGLTSDAGAAREIENKPVGQPAISDQGGGTGKDIGLPPVKTKTLKPAVKPDAVNK